MGPLDWVLFVAAVLIATTLSKAISNAYLHPLRRYPGPKLWAATRLPWCWHQYQGKLNPQILALHEKYGPVVRVAPNELSYTSETAWKTVYGHRTVEMGKDPVFSLHTPTGVQNILTADRETHARQRRLLSHAFSEKALKEQEDILMGYSNKLMEQLSARCVEGPLDLVKWFNLTTFDLIGSLSFGTDFSCLDTGIPDPFIASIRHVSRELIIGQMLRYFKLHHFRALLTPPSVAGARITNVRRAQKMVDERVTRGPTADRRDVWHYVLAAAEAEAEAGEQLGEEKTGRRRARPMSAKEMHVNAFSISIAGSESTATALAGAVHLLLTHREILTKLQSIIRGRFECESDISPTALARAPGMELLDAVINETMRLYPPVAVTLPRVVPKGGEVIDGGFVPEGVTVGVNHFAAYRSERNFGRSAAEFRPGRWMEGDGQVGSQDKNGKPRQDKAENGKEYVHRVGCFQPFSFGPRNCLGKNLAKAEMRLILARILWRFDLDLEPQGEGWMDGQQIFGFWVKPELVCKLKERC